MKGMKRTTLIMVILGGGIGGWVWWESRRVEKDDGKGKEPVELFPFLGEEVTKVELVSSTSTIAVEMKDGVWRMTAPREMPAGTTPMMTMLRGVDPSEKAYPLPAGGKPQNSEVHGLDKPRLTITLVAGDGRKASVAFGNSVGANDKVFARRTGKDEVLTVSQAMLNAFNWKAEDLRDTGFCRFDSKELTSISHSSQGQELRIARQGKGWRMTGAMEDLADPAAVAEWAARLAMAMETSAGWKTRPKPSRSEYGLDPAFATFEIVLKGKTIRIAVGAPVAEGEKLRWADTSEYADEIGTIAESKLQIVTPVAGALRATRSVPWPLAQVERFSASGAAEFEVRKESGVWTVLKPAILAGFVPDRVERLLKQISAATVLERKPAAAPPAGAIRLTLRFGPEADAVEHAADIWTDGTDTFFRTEDPERVVRSAGTSCWDHAFAGAHFFRDPVIPTGITSPLQVKSISVIGRDGIPWVEAEFNGHAWVQPTTVAGARILDSAKMSAFNQYWAGMIADTWSPLKKESPEVGLDAPPVWTIKIMPDPGRASVATARVFYVGKDGPGNTMYAVLDGEPGVFLVDPKAAGMLRSGVWKE
ncbi:MAG: hypothetical protein FD180_2497 [Planctomycetota bacterium]|nr:MAG: hypothetical protein FD180_2497 [Planctomycetota bacterium]